jgi:Holliday junction resolvase RusA-like endonuclease
MSGPITLDLPIPVSVNRTRRIDWRNHNKMLAWVKMADQFVTVAKAAKQVRFDRIAQYELHITLSAEHCKTDLDNAVKLVADYLHKREITEDDGPANMRKLTVEYGHAPAGARVVVTPIEGEKA